MILNLSGLRPALAADRLYDSASTRFSVLGFPFKNVRANRDTSVSSSRIKGLFLIVRSNLLVETIITGTEKLNLLVIPFSILAAISISDNFDDELKITFPLCM